jgi:hypothetical protein
VTVFVAQKDTKLALCFSKAIHGSEREYVATKSRWSELASFEPHVSCAFDLYSLLKFVGARGKGQSGDGAMDQFSCVMFESGETTVVVGSTIDHLLGWQLRKAFEFLVTASRPISNDADYHVVMWSRQYQSWSHSSYRDELANVSLA